MSAHRGWTHEHAGDARAENDLEAAIDRAQRKPRPVLRCPCGKRLAGSELLRGKDGTLCSGGKCDACNRAAKACECAGKAPQCGATGTVRGYCVLAPKHVGLHRTCSEWGAAEWSDMAGGR